MVIASQEEKMYKLYLYGVRAEAWDEISDDVLRQVCMYVCIYMVT